MTVLSEQSTTNLLKCLEKGAVKAKANWDHVFRCRSEFVLQIHSEEALALELEKLQDQEVAGFTFSGPFSGMALWAMQKEPMNILFERMKEFIKLGESYDEMDWEDEDPDLTDEMIQGNGPESHAQVLNETANELLNAIMGVLGNELEQTIYFQPNKKLDAHQLQAIEKAVWAAEIKFEDGENKITGTALILAFEEGFAEEALKPLDQYIEGPL